MNMRADVFFLFLGILYCKFGSKNVQSDKNEHESSVILIVIFYEFWTNLSWEDFGFGTLFWK